MLIPTKSTKAPDKSANAMQNRMYRANRFAPSTIFIAPRFVIFVAGPVIINAAALPMLIPFCSHSTNSGMVPPPHT